MCINFTLWQAICMLLMMKSSYFAAWASIDGMDPELISFPDPPVGSREDLGMKHTWSWCVLASSSSTCSVWSYIRIAQKKFRQYINVSFFGTTIFEEYAYSVFTLHCNSSLEKSLRTHCNKNTDYDSWTAAVIPEYFCMKYLHNTLHR